jgi:hypothetical protein
VCKKGREEDGTEEDDPCPPELEDGPEAAPYSSRTKRTLQLNVHITYIRYIYYAQVKGCSTSPGTGGQTRGANLGHMGSRFLASMEADSRFSITKILIQNRQGYNNWVRDLC